MNRQTLEGIVLKKTLYTDRKLIATVFTAQEGLFTLGVPIGKNHSHTLGGFEPGHRLHLEIEEKGSFRKLKDFQVLYAPVALRSSLHRLQIFSELLHKLGSLLPENMPIVPYYQFLKGALKAFETTEDPLSLKNFILLKWLQIEGILNLQVLTPYREELERLLLVKHFKELPTVSFGLGSAIESEIQRV